MSIQNVNRGDEVVVEDELQNSESQNLIIHFVTTTQVPTIEFKVMNAFLALARMDVEITRLRALPLASERGPSSVKLIH